MSDCGGVSTASSRKSLTLSSLFMGATTMNAATTALALCLVVSIAGEHCIKRPKPRYNCAKGPTGVFFPHPQDCTVLVVCVGTVDVAVTLCDDQNYLNAYDPGHTVGCRDQCPTPEGATEPCNETSSTVPSLSTPTHNESASTEYSSDTPTYTESTSTESLFTEQLSTEAASNTTIYNETNTTPSSIESLSTAVWSDIPLTSTTHGVPGHTDCISSGVFKHPKDCTKAYFCPSAGAHPVEVDVCAESRKNPNFLQGCFGDCTF